MNTQAIKTGIREHYSSEGKEAYLQERIQKQKADIINDYKSWKDKNPDKSFSDFKSHSIDELKSGMEYLTEILVIGIFITALDEINPDQDL
jgi:hypothetical protein